MNVMRYITCINYAFEPYDYFAEWVANFPESYFSHTTVKFRPYSYANIPMFFICIHFSGSEKRSMNFFPKRWQSFFTSDCFYNVFLSS